MNGFRLPINLKCDLCNNVAIYTCKAMNKKICRKCCDKYQLSSSPIDECLKCDYLFREVDYEVKINWGIVFSHTHKDKVTFDSDHESLYLKTIELYERNGVNTVDDMYNLAIQYFYANRIHKALNLYNNILNIDISDDYKKDVYEKKGDALLRLHKVDDAKDNYLVSIQCGNRRPQVFRRLGEVHSILMNFTESIGYHQLALNEYLSYEWRNEEDEESDDFLYFTNYYSLAMGYSEIGNSEKAVENAVLFLEYYGDFESIKERYFDEREILGNLFMPESIVPIYKLISLNYIKLKNLVQAKESIKKARILLERDIELARIEGFIEGKLDDSVETNEEMEKLRQSLVEKDRAIMILIENSTRNIVSYNINIEEIYMGNKYNVENKGIINNQVFGDNVNFNSGDSTIKEVSEILNEIKNNIAIIGNENIKNDVKEIEENIRNSKFSGLKNQLTNLLIGITASCIANDMGHIVAVISSIIPKLQ